MIRFSLAFLVAFAVVVPAHAAFVPAFDVGTLDVSRSSPNAQLSATYGEGSLIVSGGDLREGTGTFEDGAAKFVVGSGPITSAFLTVDVLITQGTAGLGGTIPLMVSGMATNYTAIGLADFLEPVTAGPTLTLPSTLGNDGTYQHLYSVDVTSLVSTLVAGGASTIELRFTDAASNSNVQIAGSSNLGAANQPFLTINAPLASVPEPGSATLAVLALALAGAGYAARARVGCRSFDASRAG